MITMSIIIVTIGICLIAGETNSSAAQQEIAPNSEQEENGIIKLPTKNENDKFAKHIASHNIDNYRDLFKYIQPNHDYPDGHRYMAAERLYEIARRCMSDDIKKSICQAFADAYWWDYVSLLLDYLSEETKAKLINMIKTNDDCSKPFDRLAMLNVREAIPIINQYLDDNGNIKAEKNRLGDATEFGYGNITRWRAMLALARFGDKKQIDACIAVTSVKLSKNNPAYYENLSIIEQPQAVDILLEYLFDDSSKVVIDLPSDIKYIAAVTLRKCIIEYPDINKTQNGKGMNRKEVVALCRQWIKENYTPRLIKSHSVLIDGKLYDNIADWQKGLIKVVDGKVVILDESEGAAPKASPETEQPVTAGDQGQ
jgi:hypothetical protein